MASVADLLRGGGSGALAGFSVGGPAGAAIGGGLGLLSGLVSPSEEEQASKQMQEFIEQLSQLRLKLRREAVQTLNKSLQTQLSEARQAGAARAHSAGRGGLAEAFINPIQGQLGRSSAMALRDLLLNIDQQTANPEIQARMQFAQRPLQPTALDYLTSLAGPVTEFGQQRKLLDVLKSNQYLPSGGPDNLPDNLPVQAPFEVESDITLPNLGFSLGKNKVSPLSSTESMARVLGISSGTTPALDFFSQFKTPRKKSGGMKFNMYNYLNQPGVGNAYRQNFRGSYFK